MEKLSFYSPIGWILLTSKNAKLQGLEIGDKKIIEQSQCPTLQQAKLQLEEYFAGERKIFNLPLAPQGTEFQQKCWQTLLKIPYGHLWSYSTQAKALGQKNACRAVGSANGKNPIPIIVPCHRVVAKGGGLGGYSGGLHIKTSLLQIEKTWSHQSGLKTLTS